MRRRQVVLLLLATRFAVPVCFAPPPLATGDVPTADEGRCEWYVGARYQESESGTVTRLLPFTEFVYGVADRWELTVETAGRKTEDTYGLADVVVGTKHVFVVEDAHRPGVAGSFELKLPTGDPDRGLGSGEFDYDLRVRIQRTWGSFTAIGNVGYTILGEPESGGIPEPRCNAWFLAFAQEWAVARRTTLLSELYFVSREEPGAPNRCAANVGGKYRLRDDLVIHAAIGTSLRDGNRGGPALRIYAGVKWEFGAPWRKSKEPS